MQPRGLSNRTKSTRKWWQQGESGQARGRASPHGGEAPFREVLINLYVDVYSEI